MLIAGWFAVSLVVATALIGSMIVAFGTAARRAQDSADASPVVRVTLWVAGIWAVISVIGGTVALVSTLMLTDITITIPVAQFWPQLPAGVQMDGPTADIVGGGFTSAELVGRNLSTPVRIMWAISQFLTWIIPGTIAALIAVSCHRLRGGRAFAPLVARMSLITATVVAAGGIAAQVLGDIAGSRAATELLQWDGGSYPDIAGIESVPDAWWPDPTLAITIPFWPIAAALGFAALAAVFRYGSRLQRDTDGLV